MITVSPVPSGEHHDVIPLADVDLDMVDEVPPGLTLADLFIDLDPLLLVAARTPADAEALAGAHEVFSAAGVPTGYEVGAPAPRYRPRRQQTSARAA